MKTTVTTGSGDAMLSLRTEAAHPGVMYLAVSTRTTYVEVRLTFQELDALVRTQPEKEPVK